MSVCVSGTFLFLRTCLNPNPACIYYLPRRALFLSFVCTIMSSCHGYLVDPAVACMAFVQMAKTGRPRCDR